MKLWHDDVRPAPNGWEWARTNAAAKGYLNSGLVTEVSLDHDLGYDGPPTGYDLVKWMCENGVVPPRVTVHSWNPAGAKRMAAALADHGHHCVIAPYQVPTGLRR